MTAVARMWGTERSRLRVRHAASALTVLTPALPLTILLIVFFVAPMFMILRYSVEDRHLARSLPTVVDLLRGWSPEALPSEDVFRALASDARQSLVEGTLGDAATRLNREIPGFRSALFSLAQAANEADPPLARAGILEIDPRWGELDTWRAIERASGPYTWGYLLASVDLRINEDGNVTAAPEAERIYVDHLFRTLKVAISVTLLCVAIGFPMAYAMAVTLRRWQRLLLLSVLLTFWTSILARTTGWAILLQTEGIVNDTLLFLGVTDKPIQLMFTRIAVLAAMVHIMLPYFLLPVYGAIRTFPWTQVRAAASLGASPLRCVTGIFLPQIMPGVLAGAVMVFALSTGFYITPALLGGPQDQMLSYLIAQFALKIGNWGMACALALLLAVATCFVLSVYYLARMLRVLLGAEARS